MTPNGFIAIQFWRLGVQYYLAGVYTLQNRLIDIAGNQFHHAFEMIFKARYLQNNPSADVKSQFRHELLKLWTEYIKLVGLDKKVVEKFNPIITELNRWEDIRYPNPKGGVAKHTGPTRPAKGRGLSFDNGDAESVAHFQTYEVFGDDMTELLNAVARSYPLQKSLIIAAVGMSPQARAELSAQLEGANP